MSLLRGSDEVHCDRCGRSVGNGNVGLCIVVSGLDSDRSGLVQNWHFCIEGGCSAILLNDETLADYNRRMRLELERIGLAKVEEQKNDEAV